MIGKNETAGEMIREKWIQQQNFSEWLIMHAVEFQMLATGNRLKHIDFLGIVFATREIFLRIFIGHELDSQPK